MITRQHIIKRADRDGVAPQTVERDYVLAHCLSSISRLAEATRMVFKGGTALRMCYFDEYRYSADLDFSLSDIGRVEALEAIQQALGELREMVGFPALELVTDDQTGISYQGPLGGKPRRIKLDLDDSELVLASDRRPMVPRYDDVSAGEDVLTYPLTEIGAEKLRCVIQRLQCRDFFDLHYLFEEQEVDLGEAWPMFERKAEHRGIDPSTFFDRFDVRVSHYAERWEAEMREHLPGEPPHFDVMLRELRRRLRPFR